jgi:hypothetical protein
MSFRSAPVATLLKERERALVIELIPRMPSERTVLDAILAAPNKGDFEQESLKPPVYSTWPFYDGLE